MGVAAAVVAGGAAVFSSLFRTLMGLSFKG
jgi:hypothetical protein